MSKIYVSSIRNCLAAMSLAALGSVPFFIGMERGGAIAQEAAKVEDRVVFAMSGTLAQQILQKCAEEHFTPKIGARMEFVAMQSAEALARVMAQRGNPTIDVLWSTPSTEYTGFKEGVLVPLNVSLVPNLANLDPRFAPTGESGVPVAAALQGIQYNTKIFKEKGWNPPTSWHDLWDPKYKGHVAITGLGIGTGPGILAVSGFLNGGDTKNTDAAFELLAKIKPNLYQIFQQAPPYEAAMLNGQVWLGVVSSARPLTMMEQGAPVSFIQPSEGVINTSVQASVVKGAPHPKAALAFVNWLLTKEAQTCLVAGGYGPVVAGVNVPPEKAMFLSVQRNIIPADWGYMQEKFPDIVKRWSREIDG